MGYTTQTPPSAQQAMLSARQQDCAAMTLDGHAGLLQRFQGVLAQDTGHAALLYGNNFGPQAHGHGPIAKSFQP